VNRLVYRTHSQHLELERIVKQVEVLQVGAGICEYAAAAEPLDDLFLLFCAGQFERFAHLLVGTAPELRYGLRRGRRRGGRGERDCSPIAAEHYRSSGIGGEGERFDARERRLSVVGCY
jgi:hypothetical protein